MYEEDIQTMTKTRKKRILALLLCAATLLSLLVCFASCDDKDDKDKKKEEDKGQYLTVYLSEDIYDLDPIHAYDNDNMASIVGLMFDTLFKMNENGKVEKSLVKKWWVEEDANSGEYVMYLRLKDTNWSDGTAVSANDIVFAWKRLLEVDASYSAASLLFDIKNARAAKQGDASIDDIGLYAEETQLLSIYFEGPIDYDGFIANLTSLALAPLRSDIVAKSDDWAKKPGTMVCSGPFKLSRINFKVDQAETYYDINWSEKSTGDDEIMYGVDSGEYKSAALTTITDFILERNVYYYRDAEKDGIKKSVTPYKICVDCSLTPEQITAAYECGELLYIGSIPVDLRSSGAIADAAKLDKTSSSVSALYFNEDAMIDNGTEEGEALFANPAVRQALSMAIDRKALADKLVYADAATGLIPGNVKSYSGSKSSYRDGCTADYAYLKTDLAAAGQKLSEAGITPSKYSFTLTYAEYDEDHKILATAIAEAWQSLGFKVEAVARGTITNNDYYKYTDSTPEDLCDDLYSEDLRAGQFEVILLDNVPFTSDPFGMLAPYALLFSGMAMDMSDVYNYKFTPHITGYHSDAYDELIETVFAEKNLSARAEGYRNAEAALMEDMPVCPVVFNYQATVTAKNLKGLKSTYSINAVFTKAKVSGYEKYLAAGTEFVDGNYDNLLFKESKGFTESKFATMDHFRIANTVYTQFYLADKETYSARATAYDAEHKS